MRIFDAIMTNNFQARELQRNHIFFIYIYIIAKIIHRFHADVIGQLTIINVVQDQFVQGSTVKKRAIELKKQR